MNPKLRFQLKETQHPYPDDPKASSDLWGEVAFYRIGEARELIFKIQWDLTLFLEWYVEGATERFLPLPIAMYPSESLSDALERFVNEGRQLEDEEELIAWFDMQADLRTPRSLRLALPGTITPDIIIGLNKDSGEISLSSLDEEPIKPPENARWLWFLPSSWAYTFDIEDFQKSSKDEIETFLNQALKKYSNPYIQENAKNLLAALQNL